MTMNTNINSPRPIGLRPHRRWPMPARLLARIYGVSRALVNQKANALGWQGMLDYFADRARKGARR